MHRTKLEKSFTACNCCNEAITVEQYDGEVMLCLWTVDGGFYEAGLTFWSRIGLAWRALWRGFGFVSDIHFDDVERLNRFIGLLEEAKLEMIKEQLKAKPDGITTSTKFVHQSLHEFVVLHPNHPVRKGNPELIYAVRKGKMEATWDFEADLIDEMVPMITGEVLQAYTSKALAMQAMDELFEEELKQPLPTFETRTVVGDAGNKVLYLIEKLKRKRMENVKQTT